jgi:hypothetical protein
MCAANCELSCLLRAVSFWTIDNLCGFRRKLFQRILQTVICGICNSALTWEIDFFRLRMKACLTQSSSSSGLGRPVECLFSALPTSIKYSIPSPNALIIEWSHTTLVSKFMLNLNNGSTTAVTCRKFVSAIMSSLQIHCKY